MKTVKTLSIAFTILLMNVTYLYAGIWKEDFEGGLDNWEVMLGEWEIEEDGGNHFLMTPFVESPQPAGSNDPWIRLVNKGEPVEFTDGSIEFRAKLVKSGGGVGVIFRPIIRGTDVDHCYWFSLDSRSQYSFMLLRVDVDKPNQDGYNASGEAYGNELPIVEGAVEMDTWHDVKIEIEGNHWQCYLDGEKLIDYEDEPKWAYTSGIIGFEIDCGQAVLDDVVIDGVEGFAVEVKDSLTTTWSIIKLETE